jgi:predicted nucleic acid-binding protein
MRIYLDCCSLQRPFDDKSQPRIAVEAEALAGKLGASGFKPLDALHLAFASASKVDYFCTCDDKFLRKAKSLEGLKIKVVSPTDLVMEVDI